MSKAIRVVHVTRELAGGEEEVLELDSDVVVLVGPPNAGKTKWLRMLDYALGSKKRPADAFGDELAAKYRAVSVLVRVGTSEVLFERRWEDAEGPAAATRDGKPLTAAEVGASILDLCGIPSIRYPQGDPYGPRTWPTLGWRSLLRHMFRRQSSWATLVEEQPEVEQHACILQFLGLGESLFSSEYGNLVALHKEAEAKRHEREHFLSLLQDISREILDYGQGALTPEGLDSSAEAIELAIVQNGVMREALLSKSLGVAGAGGERIEPDPVEVWAAALVKVQASLEERMRSRVATQRQLLRAQSHAVTLGEEVARLERASDAADALAPLPVTHCPACERPVQESDAVGGACYVCGRADAVEPSADGDLAARRRVELEVARVKAELVETQSIVRVAEEQVRALDALIQSDREEADALRAKLRPARTRAAATLPPGLMELDMERGRLEEQAKQLRRVRGLFERRETIARQIHEIEVRVAELEAVVTKREGAVDLTSAGDQIADGMNDYLSAINKLRPRSWPGGAVSCELAGRRFALRVGGGGWKAKLGATLTLYFLMAYQYGILRLTKVPGAHYPGLTVLDFPPVLEDQTRVADKENFVLEPFVGLLRSMGTGRGQVIAAGASFEGLKGAKRIELTRVWQ